jgi:D-alanine-D-alanine ligase
MANSKQNKPWYKEFFQNFYLNIYKDVLPLLRTEKEVNFIINILKLPKGSKILDLGGGYGRISVFLAKRGYKVYIQDLNKDFLEKAKREAKKQKIKIKTIHSDMRKIPFNNEFDAVINIFNSFGYLENDKEDNKVLQSINKALKPKGKLLIDVLNGNWLKNNYQPKTWRKLDDTLILEENRLDKKTSRNIVEILILDLKNCKSFSTLQNLRIYSFSELKRTLSNNGLKIIKKYGSFDKEKFSSKSSKRIIILAEKIK